MIENFDKIIGQNIQCNNIDDKFDNNFVYTLVFNPCYFKQKRRNAS